MIPGPEENNWVLKLKYPVQCFDSDGRNYNADTFLLKPIGLDDEKVMKNPPWEPWRVTEKEELEELEALASILEENNWPSKIETYEDYKKHPLINAVTIRVDKPKNIHLRIVK